VCFRLNTDFHLFDLHVGDVPLPATEGWTCTFYPSDQHPFWSWDIEEQARHFVQAARLWGRIP